MSTRKEIKTKIKDCEELEGATIQLLLIQVRNSTKYTVDWEFLKNNIEVLANTREHKKKEWQAEKRIFRN